MRGCSPADVALYRVWISSSTSDTEASSYVDDKEGQMDEARDDDEQSDGAGDGDLRPEDRDGRAEDDGRDEEEG